MLRSACLLALALASGSAQALGLGQIQVKSALGEPLLAEIPIVSNDPSELVSLDAGLASPETFTRVGLEPPIGIVADLRFTIGSDAQGRPLIRITTVQPVTQPLLDFLVQVDWGQGRLVREFTATMAAPGSVTAAPEVAVQAPAVESAPVIERAAVPAASAANPAASQTPARPQAAVRPAPPQGAAPRPAASVGASTYRVRAGDTASQVAARVAPTGVTTEQAMVGLLRENPDAFVGGDLNQLRRGSVLRVPAAGELEAVEAREAAALVRASAARWRQARTQPQAAVTAAASPATAQAAAEPAGRLEIVPPGAGRKARGGTQSGIEAGGEGEMLRQELVQTKESLAARDAEVQELKSRVAELEKLQNDQQKLIAMQNSQLHAAQQRPATPPPAPRPDTHASPLPWIAGGVLVVAGLLAAAWNRRRARREPAFRAPAAAPGPSVGDAFAAVEAPSRAVASAVEDAPVDARPSWERGGSHARPAARKAAPLPPLVEPDTHVAADDATEPSAVERLELAQAYLDLGDANNARRLLGEVMDSGDATARGVAAQMLRDIG